MKGRFLGLGSHGEEGEEENSLGTQGEGRGAQLLLPAGAPLVIQTDALPSSWDLLVGFCVIRRVGWQGGGLIWNWHSRGTQA